MIVNPINLSIQDYWKRVREIQRGLPDAVTLASIPERMLACNPDERERGSVRFIEAESLTAAQCIFAGTHRVATEDEIVAQEKRRETDLRELTRRHLASQGIVAIQLSDKTSSE
jgi:hypothetical protein